MPSQEKLPLIFMDVVMLLFYNIALKISPDYHPSTYISALLCLELIMWVSRWHPVDNMTFFIDYKNNTVIKHPIYFNWHMRLTNKGMVAIELHVIIPDHGA